MQDYRKLVVWQRAHQLVLSVYSTTTALPEGERFGLASQMRRAAVSVPANIAEGCGRETPGELKRFLYVAMGSARELDYHLLLARDLHFIEAQTYKRLAGELDEIQRMLNVLIHKLVSQS